MVTAPPETPTLPAALVREVCSRLDPRTSSVESPHWSPDHQQLHLLDTGPQEPTVHHDQPEQLIRFQGLAEERQLWLDLLPTIEDNTSRVDRFRHCGAFASVRMDNETGHPYLDANTCKLRVCPACRKVLQYKTLARVLDFLYHHPADNWQFHTYTLRHSESPLTEQLDRLVHCFRLLRHRRLWKQRCGAGYAVIEITYHPAGSWSPNGRQRTTDEWHPHLHVLVQTTWLDWSLLHQDWREITTDSTQLDCANVTNLSHAARYVAKYLGKPPTLDFANDHHRATEYYHAINHRRLLMPFGIAAKHTLPPPPLRHDSTYLCRLSTLHEAALRGSWPAQCMLTVITLALRPQYEDRKPNRQPELPFERSPP